MPEARVRRRQSTETIGAKDRAIRHIMRGENSSHQDARATAPDTGLDIVARDVLPERRFNEVPQIPQAPGPDHRMGPQRPPDRPTPRCIGVPDALPKIRDEPFRLAL